MVKGSRQLSNIFKKCNMKIIHLITTIERGGAENQLLTLVNQQVKQGLGVEIIPLKGKPELKEDFELVGASVDLMILNKNPISQVYRLRKKIKSSKDSYIIHSHLPRAELLSACSGNEIRVFSRHNSENFFPRKYCSILSIILSRFSSFKSKSGIAISNDVKNFELNNSEIGRNFPFEVVYYGYERKIFDSGKSRHYWRNELKISNEQILIGTVARLAKQKNLHLLLQAFQLFVKAQPNSKLIIVGDGPLKAELEKLANHLNINEKVIFLGRSNKVREIMSAMDLFILPSFYEGFGLVLLEAMDAGCRIIGSNTSAIPEVIGNRPDQLFSVSDKNELVSKMNNLLFNTDMKDILIRNSQRLEEFDATKMQKAILSVYKKAGFKE